MLVKEEVEMVMVVKEEEKENMVCWLMWRMRWWLWCFGGGGGVCGS